MNVRDDLVKNTSRHVQLSKGFDLEVWSDHEAVVAPWASLTNLSYRDPGREYAKALARAIDADQSLLHIPGLRKRRTRVEREPRPVVYVENALIDAEARRARRRERREERERIKEKERKERKEKERKERKEKERMERKEKERKERKEIKETERKERKEREKSKAIEQADKEGEAGNASSEEKVEKKKPRKMREERAGKRGEKELEEKKGDLTSENLETMGGEEAEERAIAEKGELSRQPDTVEVIRSDARHDCCHRGRPRLIHIFLHFSHVLTPLAEVALFGF